MSVVASRIRHVGLVVKDLEKSLEFYRDILGLTIFKRIEETGEYIDKLVGIKKVKVEWIKLNLPDGGLIELLQYHSHPDKAKKPKIIPSNRVGFGHVALTVTDLDNLHKILVKNGYKCNSKPLYSPANTKILYCHDPDGIIVELIQDFKLVSIGVPTYNRATTYLPATLESIRNQTYTNLEIIISDNGSSDNTEAVCQEFVKKDSRIRYIRQQSNIGPTANFNILRREFKGDYFLHKDDDDLLDPTFIEKCVARLESNPEAIMAAANFVEFDDKGGKISYSPSLYWPSEKDLYQRLKKYILLYEADGKDKFLHSGLWRRNAVSNYMFDERLFPDVPGWDFEDMDFVFKGLTWGTFELVDEVLFFKRVGSNSFDPPAKKFFWKRIYDSLLKSRLKRFWRPFFYKRMGTIISCPDLNWYKKSKLLFWNFFVMSRFFWKRKI